MIPAVPILSKSGLSAMKDNTGPVHVDVGMLEIVPRKKDIMDVRDDFFPISTKDFKDAVKCSLTERTEGKFLKHFGSVDPIVRSFDAEVIRQFVADEGSK
jgi:hypothetical protein